MKPSTVYSLLNKKLRDARRVSIPAQAISLGTGTPSLALYSSSIARVPHWSMSGATAGQGITAYLGPLGEFGQGVKISATIITPSGSPVGEIYDVLQAKITSLVPGLTISDAAVNTTSGPILHKTLNEAVPGEVVIESFVPADLSHPIMILLSRLVSDPADTWSSPIGIVAIHVTPVIVPTAIEIQPNDGYNAWPFISSIGNELVCVYGKGLSHEDNTTPDIYKRTSIDGGSSWSDEQLIINTVGVRDTITGKGKDSNGNMLLWDRKGAPGPTSTHHIYRSSDGDTFELISSPTFGVAPSHISDIFSVPSVGLMAFYNANVSSVKSWGIVTSADNGITWSQTVIESSLSDANWPTEISGAYTVDGKIIALGRKEQYVADTTYAMFQIQSGDYGATWSKTSTNITDISLSTPSLIYNPEDDMLSLYYFHRGFGVLRLRKAATSIVWDQPLNWPVSQPIALGTRDSEDTGNANAVSFGDYHVAVYYSGDGADTGIYGVVIPQ